MSWRRLYRALSYLDGWLITYPFCIIIEYIIEKLTDISYINLAGGLMILLNFWDIH